MGRTRHIPIRTCLGCRGRERQAEMLRLTAAPTGTLFLDREGHSPGRGGYLHRNAQCWEAFVTGRPFLRSFRQRVSREERRRLVAMLTQQGQDFPGHPRGEAR